MKAKRHFKVWRIDRDNPGMSYIKWQCIAPIAVLTASVAYMMIVGISGVGFASRISLALAGGLAAIAYVLCRVSRIMAYCSSRSFVLCGDGLYIYAYDKLSPSGRFRDAERFSSKYMSRAVNTGRNINTLTESGLIEHLLDGSSDFGEFGTPVCRLYRIRKILGIYFVKCAADVEGKIRFSFALAQCYKDMAALIKTMENISEKS